MANNQEKQSNNLIERPPIVVVMGHIDHGKTKILDYIRKTKVAEKEAGGITQSIGAYEVSHNSKIITFIDTPGHEAFSKMRSRGAKVADIAVLVVAADEGIKPQTKEAYAAIKEANVPFLVALNKTDKPEADPNRVRKDLADIGILTEGWGGGIPCVLTSAKTGEGIEELLDTLLLMAEMEELKGNPEAPGYGIIIESHLDKRRGITVTTVIKNGAIKKGDLIKDMHTADKIKILEDFRGKPIESASFSSPVRILGFEELPEVGAEVITGDIKFYEEMAKKMIDIIQAPMEIITGVDISKTEPIKEGEPAAEIIAQETKPQKEASVHLILKADVSGSLEALNQLIKDIDNRNPDVEIEIIRSGLGDISEGDIKLADLSKIVILAFNVDLRPEIKMLAQTSKIKIIKSNIIYKIIEEFETILKSLSASKEENILKGELEILAVFGKVKGRRIIGGKVAIGKITKNSKTEIWRQDAKIGTGKIINLQEQKQDVESVKEGKECGLLLDSETKLETGDRLKIY